MPATNLQFVDLQNRVLSMGFGEADRTNVKMWLNMAQADVMGKRRWSWAVGTEPVSTTANQQTLTISTLTEVPLYWGRLKPLDPTIWEPRYIDTMSFEDDFNRHSLYSTDIGQPRAYSIWNGVLTFYPIPDAVYNYTLHYWRGAVDLSGDTDVPLIPGQYRNILVLGALVYAALRDRDNTALAARTKLYEDALEEMYQAESLPDSESPKRARMPRSYHGMYDQIMGTGSGWWA